MLPDGLRPGGRFDDWKPGQVRYLVADVDGTLVGASGVLSDAVIEAARSADTAGLTVGFATGRARMGVDDLWGDLALPGPHVFHNGAEVRHGERTVASWPLGVERLDAVLEIADDLDMYVELYEPDRFWVNRLDERAVAHWALLGTDPVGVASDELDGDKVLKATFALFEGQDQQALVDALAARGVKPGPAHSPVTPRLRYVNATDPVADKGHALRRAAALIDVDLADTVAVGDALNDLPMLAEAGTAIAMGQSDQEVLDLAHLIAPPVDEDGIVTVLKAAPGLQRPSRRRPNA